MKLGVLGILFLSFLSFQLSAQKAMPVKWQFDIEKINETDYNVIFTASIDKGWYVYSQYLESDMGPIPTSFTFDNAADLELESQPEEIGEKIEKFDKLFDMNITKYANEVKFIQKVRNTKGAKEVVGSLEFMTCDDHQCLPPKSLDFKLEF